MLCNRLKTWLKFGAVAAVVLQAAAVQAQQPIEQKLKVAYGYNPDAQMYNVFEVKMPGVLRAGGKDTVLACPEILEDGKPQPASFGCKLAHAGSATVAATVAVSNADNDPATHIEFVHGFYKPGIQVRLESISTLTTKKDKDQLEFKVMDFMRAEDGSVTPPSTHAAIVFQFPKGYLQSADPAQVMQVVSKVLEPHKAPRIAQPQMETASNAGGPSPSLPPPPPMNTVPLPVTASAPQSLDQQLKSLYTLTLLASNSTVQTQGSVLSVTKDNTLLGTPIAKPALCPASYASGAVKPPTATCVAPLKAAIARHDAAYLTPGQKVSIIAISVDMSKETVVFSLVDNTAGSAPRWHTAISFVFPKGYLEAADAGQIAETVNSLLPISSDGATNKTAGL